MSYHCPVGFACPLDWCQGIFLLVCLGVGFLCGRSAGHRELRRELERVIRNGEWGRWMEDDDKIAPPTGRGGGTPPG